MLALYVHHRTVGVYRSQAPTRKGPTRSKMKFGTALLETAPVVFYAKLSALMRGDAGHKVTLEEWVLWNYQKLIPHLGRRLEDVIT